MILFSRCVYRSLLCVNKNDFSFSTLQMNGTLFMWIEGAESLPGPEDEVNVVSHLGLHKSQNGGDELVRRVAMVVA